MLKDAWLRDVRKSAEKIATLDPMRALHDGERMMISQAAIILQLLAEIERLQAERRMVS